MGSAEHESETGAGAKKRTGGSVTVEARGLRRGGGEVNSGPPVRFCVVGGVNPGDASEAALRERYAGNAWALAIIGAALDVYRAAEPAPEFFWHRLRDGVHTAIRYADLGEDNEGEIVLLVIDGRHRKDGLIRVNEEREETAEPEPFDLPCHALKLPKGEANAERAAEIVRRVKTDCNIAVAMAPSHLASRAIEWSARGLDAMTVGQKIGLRAERCEQDVPCYLALAECIREVQEYVDREPRWLATVGRWRSASGELRRTPEEQRAWLAARTAPRASAAPAPRAARKPTARRLDAFTAQLSSLPAMAQAVGLARGTLTIGEVTDDEVRRAWLASEAAR